MSKPTSKLETAVAKLHNREIEAAEVINSIRIKNDVHKKHK